MQRNVTSAPFTSEDTNEMGDVSFGFKVVSLVSYVAIKATNALYVPHFLYRLFQKPKRCAPLSDDVLRIPAGILAAKIRKRELSCEDVIKSYIGRIREVNPVLNAVIEDRFQEAIEEAKQIDEFLSSAAYSDADIEQERPLLGVPFTVKGSLEVKGLRNTSGVVSRRSVANKDAEAVGRARAAGAIPLLTSNVPEMCLDWETSNKLIGATNNPYDVTKTCGGSSGGEASLIASGASLLGIGSDVAGSLRLPAHFCGVYGHKPSPGVVSVEGHYPSSGNRPRWERVFAVGPLARYAADLRTFLKVIATPDAIDALRLDDKVDVTSIKVHYVREIDSVHCDKANRDVIAALDKVVGHFKATQLDLPLMKRAPEVASIHLLDMDDVENAIEDGDGSSVSEFLRYVTFRSEHTLMAILFGLVRRVYRLVPEGVKKEADRYLDQIGGCIADALGDRGVLVMPAYPREAHFHKDSLRNTLTSGYLSIFNALGFPVTNCPVGFTKEGLPVGVQVVALPYCDRLTLAVAEEIERAFGGWVPPQ